MDKVFIDTDIILDLVQEREPHSKFATILFSMIEKGVVKGHVSSLIFANIYYILRKRKSSKFAIGVLRKLKAILRVLPVNEKIIELALSSNFNDFEDAIQYYTALENNIQYLITRNKKDYKEKGLMICNSREFLNLKEMLQ
jgi:predicted nucleic acid-binding protein